MDFLAGRDAQLEKAVEVLKQEIQKKPETKIARAGSKCLHNRVAEHATLSGSSEGNAEHRGNALNRSVLRLQDQPAISPDSIL